jgi:hypothetical protein
MHEWQQDADGETPGWASTGVQGAVAESHPFTHSDKRAFQGVDAVPHAYRGVLERVGQPSWTMR